MNIMKKQQKKWFIFFLFTAGFMPVIQAQTSLVGLNVNEKSGKQSTYALNSLKNLTFKTGNMAINKKDGSIVSVPTINVSYLNFSYVTAVKDVFGNNNSDLEKMMLSPNPVKNHFQIRYESQNSENTVIEIINMQGKVVLQQSFNILTGINYIDIPFESYQNGIYFCRLLNENQPQVAKFIKY